MKKLRKRYTANTSGGSVNPTVAKEQLIARIWEVLEKTRNFMSAQNFDLQTD